MLLTIKHCVVFKWNNTCRHVSSKNIHLFLWNMLALGSGMGGGEDGSVYNSLIIIIIYIDKICS